MSSCILAARVLPEWILDDESWIGRDASASLHNEQLTQN